MSDDLKTRIITYVEHHPGCVMEQVAHGLGVSIDDAQDALDALSRGTGPIASHRVKSAKYGNAKAYFVLPHY